MNKQVHVGQVVNLLHITGTDMVAGDTTVVSVNARTGSFTLANGMSFHKDGRGHARNNACMVGPAKCVWNDRTLPYEVRNAAFKAYRQEVNPGEPVADLQIL